VRIANQHLATLSKGEILPAKNAFSNKRSFE